MFAQTISIKKLAAFFISGLFLSLLLLAPNVSAADTKHELCTGANLTFEQKAGCDKERKSDGSFGKIDESKGEGAESRVSNLINDIINIIMVIVGIAAVVMIIYGGFKFITSAGNPENTKAARNAILYALIGLVIVAFAQFIVKFVLGKLNI
jgi:hypothetical protein